MSDEQAAKDLRHLIEIGKQERAKPSTSHGSPYRDLDPLPHIDEEMREIKNKIGKELSGKTQEERAEYFKNVQREKERILNKGGRK